MVLGPFSPDRRRPACSRARSTWSPALDASPSDVQKLPEAPQPSGLEQSMHLLIRTSELTPPKVLHDAPDDSPSYAPLDDSPWLVQTPTAGVLYPSPSVDNNAGCFVDSYDANAWPADSTDLSPAYELCNTYMHSSPERTDESSNNPPLYDKSNWRAFEVCVNPPNATWVGATLVGETHDHRCRLIIAETGAEMQLGWNNLCLMASENPPQLREHVGTLQGAPNKLATEASLRRLMTLRTDGPNWQSIAQSMIDDGHATDGASCEIAWMELMQRKPPGSLPPEELEKRFWTQPGRRVDLYDVECWCPGVTVTDTNAVAGRSSILLDSGETVSIFVPDYRVRLSLLVPPSSILDRVRFIPDAVRTAADVTLIAVEGKKTKYCSLRDLVLLLRGRQESRTLQQQAPAMASEQMALDLISTLHPSEFTCGISIGDEIGATAVSLAGVEKILRHRGINFDRLKLSQIDIQLIKAMGVANDPSGVRHLCQSPHTSRDKSTHANRGTTASKLEATGTVSVYSGRLRATPQRLDPCQPANQLSVPRASVVTFSDAPPVVKRLDARNDEVEARTSSESLDTESEMTRAVNWDKKNQRKTGPAALFKHDKPAYLKENPSSEVASGQGEHSVSYDSSEYRNCGTARSRFEADQNISEYSGRLRATPQRLNPCQPADKSTGPRAPVSTISDSSPILESLDTEEMSCSTRNTDAHLLAETAKCVAPSLWNADGSSPRTPATLVLGDTRCTVSTGADRIQPKTDTIDDDMTRAVKTTSCPKCRLGGGLCRHRNKPGHLVDPSNRQESVAGNEEKQNSQAKNDIERGLHSDQDKIDSERALTQQLPVEALSNPAGTKCIRHPKITKSTVASHVSTSRTTRSSAAKTFQADQSKTEAQNCISFHQKNEPENSEKPNNLFSSGGAVAPWTKFELGVLNDTIAAQGEQVEAGSKSVSVVVGRTPDGCYSRYHRTKRQKKDVPQCARKRKKV